MHRVNLHNLTSSVQSWAFRPYASVPLKFRGTRLTHAIAGGGNNNPRRGGRTMSLDIFRTEGGDHVAVATYTTQWTHESPAEKVTVLCEREFSKTGDPIWSLDELMTYLVNDNDPLHYASLPYREPSPSLHSHFQAENDQVTLLWAEAREQVFAALGYFTEIA